MHALFTMVYIHIYIKAVLVLFADFTEMIDKILSTVDDTTFGKCIAKLATYTLIQRAKTLFLFWILIQTRKVGMTS